MLFISSVGIAEPKKVAPEKSDSTLPQRTPHEASGLGVDDARELLDWLEARGISQTSVETDTHGRLTIRWDEFHSN